MKNRQPLQDDPPGIKNIEQWSHAILRNIARWHAGSWTHADVTSRNEPYWSGIR
jgi:hypothetical protein